MHVNKKLLLLLSKLLINVAKEMHAMQSYMCMCVLTYVSHNKKHEINILDICIYVYLINKPASGLPDQIYTSRLILSLVTTYNHARLLKLVGNCI